MRILLIRNSASLTIMVKSGDNSITMANRRLQSATALSEQTVRATISFPELEYSELERIAQDQRVSLAWVVREAVEQYLSKRPAPPERPHKQTNGHL